MNTIQINYDLRVPGNYAKVETYIKQYGWSHLLESCWLISTTKSAGTVRDELKKVVHPTDKVAVFDVTNVSWGTNFSDDATTWLKAA